MVSRVGLKSVPADLVVFDELDEARDQSAVDMAIERMAQSEFKEVLMLPNPSLPDFGIDAAFQQTDQCYWLIKCQGCRRWCNLVEYFPECLRETAGGQTIRACVGCEKQVDISAGQWVAKRPGADRRGYQHSQLHSAFVKPAELLRKFRTARTLTNFYNLNLVIFSLALTLKRQSAFTKEKIEMPKKLSSKEIYELREMLRITGMIASRKETLCIRNR